MAYKNNTRIDPSKNDTTAFTYSQQATIITDEAYHGGGDVAVYALGKYTGYLCNSNFASVIYKYILKFSKKHINNFIKKL